MNSISFSERSPIGFSFTSKFPRANRFLPIIPLLVGFLVIYLCVAGIPEDLLIWINPA